MDAASLRALQAPIKERYKTNPEAVVITLKAMSTLDEHQYRVQGRDWPRPRGSGLELCSGDMLLEALVACAGVSL
jgi:hypothetical protein